MMGDGPGSWWSSPTLATRGPNPFINLFVPSARSTPRHAESDAEERRQRPRRPRREDLASPTAQAFYRKVMETLRANGIDFLVGGAYAFTPYTGIDRSTKDFDLFVHADEIHRALDILARAGFRTELTFPHWLAKVFHRKDFVDLIFNSGNGVTPVDDGWFEHAPAGHVLGLDVKLAPAEEMLWSKSFVQERERFDGADVIHIIRSRAERLDWDRIVARFGDQWRVLLQALVMFGFVYPSERARIPTRVMTTLVDRLRSELTTDADVGRLCQGTMVSRQQYLPDTLEWGYADGRLPPTGHMSVRQIEDWTAAIGTIK